MQDNGNNDKRQAEALSAAIDRLNRGLPPDGNQEQEIAELLYTAKLIKGAVEQPTLPPIVQSRIVEKVVGEITRAKRKKRMLWALSSLAGAVAAVVLVVLLNVMPPAIEQEQAKSSQPVPEQAAETPPPSITKTPSNLTDPVGGNQVPSPTVREKPSMPKQAQTQPEEQNGSPMVALVPSASSVPADSGTMLALADSKADMITIDAVTKTIRQVYHQAAPDELIITQVPQSTNMPRAASKSAQVQNKLAVPLTREAVKIKPLNHNKVTVMIDNNEVTLEGAYTEAELRNLATKLTKVSVAK